MSTEAQPSADDAASQAAIRMRQLHRYERQWLIIEGERAGKVVDMRHIWRGGLEAMTQESLW